MSRALLYATIAARAAVGPIRSEPRLAVFRLHLSQ